LARRTRELAVIVLVFAVLVGASVALLSSSLISYSIDEIRGEGVTVKYASVNPAIPSFIVRLPGPRIYVTDLAGRKIAGIIVNIFAGMPRARITYLGRVAGDGSSATLTPNILRKVRTSIMPEWRSALGNIQGFKTALLTFIDVLVPTKSNKFEVYSFVKTVPVNLGLLDAGYRIMTIKIVVNTAVAKPTEVVGANNAGTCTNVRGTTKAVSPAIKTEGTEIQEGCEKIFCGKLTCTCYCSKWVLERTYAHIENKLIPIMMARWAQKYYTTPQAMFLADLAFAFNDTVMNWFKIYASAKIAGSPHVTLLQWESFTNKFDFSYAKAFFNSRWTSRGPSFKDDAIVAIGFVGSATLGEFRKYEASCYCGITNSECSSSDYRATSVTANITVMDISLRKSGDKWVGTYGYLIDDNLNDGKGLQKLWALVMGHSKSLSLKTGTGEVRYFYTGSKTSEIDMGVDVGDIVTWFITEGTAKTPAWVKDFPLDAGIDWGMRETINGAIFLHAISYYSDYYVFLSTYKSRDKVYLGNDEVPIKLMYFDIDIYPPSGV